MTKCLFALLLTTLLPGADWYVDSVNGNDAGGGSQSDAPFQTIDRLSWAPLHEKDTIYLARGSHWREELRGLPEGTSVIAYGQGERPLLDASDIAAQGGWQRDGELYTIVWPHNMQEPNKNRFSVWEDGLRLKRVESIQDARVRAGSFYAALPDAGAAGTIYLHPSSDPAGHLYEISRREFALAIPNGGQAHGIHTRRNGHNNGSLVGGSGVLFKDCVAEDGTVHNVLLQSGVVEDVVAWKNEIYTGWGSSTMFVSYAASGSGMGTIFRRSKAIGGDPARPGETGGAVGFFQHANSEGVTHAFLVIEDCEASGLAVGFGGIAEHVLITGGSISRTLRAVNAEATVSQYITGLRIDGDDGQILMSRAVEGPSPRTLIHQLDVSARLASGALVWLNGEVDISQSRLAFVNIVQGANTGVRIDRGVLRMRGVAIEGADVPVEIGSEAKLNEH